MGGKVIEVESKAQWDEIIALAKKDGKVVCADLIVVDVEHRVVLPPVAWDESCCVRAPGRF